VVGPQAYHRLPELLAEAERKAAILKAGKRLPGAGVLDTEFPLESKVRPPAGAAGRARGFGLPVDPGRLRQVLHLLRRALHARR
jgi:tRNA-2-methylthio-N6-dimethylallyladenosine synthase